MIRLGSDHDIAIPDRLGTVAAFGQMDTQIGHLGPFPGTLDSHGFNRIVTVAQPGCIKECHRQATQISAQFKNVAGRSGNIRHQRDLSLADAVQQAGFPGIRRTDNRDLIAMPQRSVAG
jgi:hypothetical protein